MGMVLIAIGFFMFSGTVLCAMVDSKKEKADPMIKTLYWATGLLITSGIAMAAAGI